MCSKARVKQERDHAPLQHHSSEHPEQSLSLVSLLHFLVSVSLLLLICIFFLSALQVNKDSNKPTLPLEQDQDGLSIAQIACTIRQGSSVERQSMPAALLGCTRRNRNILVQRINIPSRTCNSWFLNVVAKGAMAAQGGYGQGCSTNQDPWSHQHKPLNRQVLCDFDRWAVYAPILRPALSALINFIAGAHTLVESDWWLTPKPPRPAGNVHNKQLNLSNTCWLTALEGTIIKE